MAIVPTKSDRIFLKQEFSAFAANGMRMSCKGRKTYHRGIYFQAGFAKLVRKKNKDESGTLSSGSKPISRSEQLARQ